MILVNLDFNAGFDLILLNIKHKKDINVSVAAIYNYPSIKTTDFNDYEDVLEKLSFKGKNNYLV